MDLWPLLLAAGLLACVPMKAGAQPAADLVAERGSSSGSVPDAGPGLVFEPLAQDLDSDGQVPTPAASATDRSPTAGRDSIKNGLLIGAAVAAVLGVVASRIADCPDSAEGSCPGTKALGIAITVAAGAAIGAGIDLLFAVDAAPGGMTPTGVRPQIVVAGRIRW